MLPTEFLSDSLPINQEKFKLIQQYIGIITNQTVSKNRFIEVHRTKTNITIKPFKED